MHRPNPGWLINRRSHPYLKTAVPDLRHSGSHGPGCPKIALHQPPAMRRAIPQQLQIQPGLAGRPRRNRLRACDRDVREGLLRFGLSQG